MSENGERPPGGDTALMPTLTNDELAATIANVKITELDDTIAVRAGSTIEPQNRSVDSVGQRAVENLDPDRSHHLAAGLSFGRTIGEGGMGLVRAAVQRSLGRDVAVKTLKADVKDDRARLRLLREAWVTGSLEHPNIVPVYDLGLGEDGAPLIVLKLIEGSPWSEVARVENGAEDLLEKNLRIFVQVCNAVSLAHARGVIHRDLKPDNVMIGRFGEVYLVDWGIAVSLERDPSGRLPHVSEATEMAGTPAYMAPEMVGGTGAVLSERTDVYLLGAILYELLVGRPPHQGENLRQIIASIVVSNIRLPPAVPRELAAIVTRACQRDPAERFASAMELRERVDWYLRHRGSLALSAAAAARVAEMREAVERTDRTSLDVDDLREKMHRLFAEARFGFRQAILASPDNDAAKSGIHEATTLVVELELASGTAEAAAAALAELEAPPPALAARVQAARDEEKKRFADLEKLRADMDRSTGQRTRMVVGTIFGVTWTVTPFAVDRLVRTLDPTPPFWTLYVFTGVLAVFALGVTRWGRESMMKTTVNRHTIAAVYVLFAAQLGLEIACHIMGVAWAPTLTLHIFGWFLSITMFAVLLDRRMLLASAGFFGTMLWAAMQPERIYYAMALGNFTLLVNFVIAWSRPRADATFFVERMHERHRAVRERRANRWMRLM